MKKGEIVVMMHHVEEELVVGVVDVCVLLVKKKNYVPVVKSVEEVHVNTQMIPRPETVTVKENVLSLTLKYTNELHDLVVSW